MGVVYLAHDPQLDRQVALKIPLISAEDDSDFLKRFFREAQVAAKFHHPNICPVYDMGTHDGRPFLSLAYIEGQSLAEHLNQRQSPVEPAKAAQLVRILALAIQKAHDAGIIHRDLKPGNIMISSEGRPIVMDFGLARRDEPAESLRTRTGQIMGTPAYMPLEQYRGDVHVMGPGCDIYSLGVILYQLLTSRLPYEGSAAAVFEMLVTSTAPPRPSSLRAGIDASLEAICLKAMAREIGDRYPSMTQFAKALGGWLPSVAGGAAPQPKRELTNSVPPVKPAGVIDAEGLPRQTPVASGRREPAVSSQLVGAPPQRRTIPWLWFYVAALLLLAFLGVIIYSVTDSGNKKAASPSSSAAAGSKPASPSTHVESPKLAPPSQKPQPRSPQPMREWTNSIGMKFARIEPGEFVMGSTKGEVDQLMRVFPEFKRESWDGEEAAHLVKITRAFSLGLHEVTQGEYQAVMGQNPSRYKASADRPVERVSWLDAVRFCNNLSEREGEKRHYQIHSDKVTVAGNNGYRLRTEAEWEYACRAGRSTVYPFGGDAGALGKYAWNGLNSEGKTHPVGQKWANAWGLYDMLGNVSEWCADGHEEHYYASSPAADPPGPSGASLRVFRGGCWGSLAWLCRPAVRGRAEPGGRSPNLGFRVAAVLE